jgi:phosphosulfolactate synthase
MNFTLPHLPKRPKKVRKHGITMVMDKGLSIQEAESLIEKAADSIDYIKLGFGTALITQRLEEKIKLYKEANIKVYTGGTLFEAFLVRDKFDAFRSLMNDFTLDTVEVSDGSINLPHDLKLGYIEMLAKDFNVLSEVGSKEAGIIISPGKWTSMMNAELAAGSQLVIAEARESGNVGIYRPNGSAHTILVNRILNKVPGDKILWEAPQKSQQVWFIKTIGANVNLGNISPEEIIPLECLRLGLRGDTFFEFLPENQRVSSFKHIVLEEK